MDSFAWVVVTSGNPNKSWIMTRHGDKVTKLIGSKTARLIVNAHNKAVEYLTATTER